MTPDLFHLIFRGVIYLGMFWMLVQIVLARHARARLIAEARREHEAARQRVDDELRAKLEREILRRHRDPWHIHKPSPIETVDGEHIGYMCSDCLELCSGRQPKRYEVETEEHWELGSEEPVASIELRTPVYDDQDFDYTTKDLQPRRPDRGLKFDTPRFDHIRY